MGLEAPGGLIADHLEELSPLARAWLAAGAAEFSVWEGGRQLKSWRNGSGLEGGCLSTPLVIRGERVGELQVSGLSSHAHRVRLQTEADILSRYLPLLEECEMLAKYVASQAENLQEVQTSVNSIRLETEVELAQEIQANLLPRSAPAVPGLEMWITSRPALDVGGDFYDFIPGPRGLIYFVIGDISGKGMPAALMMAITLKVIRIATGTRSGLGPDRIIERLNSELYQDFRDAVMFCTLFAARYNPRNRVISYFNAGHSPIIYCPVGEKPRMLAADSTPIGLFPRLETGSHRIRLSPGDLLVLATDGFNERMNDVKRLFGFTRLTALAGELASRSPREISETIIEEVERFGGGRVQEDDQTMIVIKCVEPDGGERG